MKEEDSNDHVLHHAKQRCRLDAGSSPDEYQLNPPNIAIGKAPSSKQQGQCPIFTLGFVVGGSITCFITADKNNGYAIAIWMAILWIIIGSLVLSTMVHIVMTPPTTNKECVEFCEYSSTWTDEEDESDSDTVTMEEDEEERQLV